MTAMPWHFGNAVGDEIDHIDARNTLLLEQEHRLTFLLTENRHQHVGACHFSLPGALYMEYRALQYPLKAQGRLSLTFFVMLWNQRGGGIDELLKVVTQFVEVGTACAQYAGGRLVIQ